jgi:hypothetical protein
MEFSHDLVRPDKEALKNAHERERETFKLSGREMSWVRNCSDDVFVI